MGNSFLTNHKNKNTERGNQLMKKIFSALLVAVLLTFTVACAIAVQAEESGDDSVVLYNFLAALTNGDAENYTVKTNQNGSVTVTLKKDASEDEPILLATYTDAKIDLSKPAFFAADYESASADMDFCLHYTRTDKTADLYFTGAKKANEHTKHETDKSIVWDLTTYISGDKRFENNLHEFKDLAITAGKSGDAITFNTLAIISDADAMTVGTPLVGPAADTPSDSSSTETSSVTSSVSSASSVSSTSSAGSTSGQVPAGDTGMIIYVVLALLGAAGAVAVVRVRQ